jgi:hypothetical protein
METIKKISTSMQRKADFRTLLGNFLDTFKQLSKKEKLLSIKDEPISGNKEKRAYLAACVEELCIKFDLKIPSWVNKQKYFLSSPVFYSRFENVKATLLQESPTAFRRRNLFVSKNALMRA